MSFQYNLSDAKDSNDFTSLLEHASKDELEELMDNEDKINEIICDQDKIKKLKLDKELIQAENRSLADHNIGKEPQLNRLRDTLAAKYEQLQELNETFQTNQARLESLHKDVNLETMLAVLETTCAQTEEESEEMAEQFFKGNMDLGEFVDAFKNKRTQAHLRRIKMEKMRELILEEQRNPKPPSSSAPSIPPRKPSNSGLSALYSSSQAPKPDPVGAYPAQYVPPTGAHPSYPANAFGQPPAQQYPAYKWR